MFHKKIILVILFSVTIKFSILKTISASCNQGCDFKNRLTIGKFSTIDSSREMDAKKLHFYF